MTECMKCGKQEGVLRWDTELPLVCHECYLELLKERWIEMKGGKEQNGKQQRT